MSRCHLAKTPSFPFLSGRPARSKPSPSPSSGCSLIDSHYKILGSFSEFQPRISPMSGTPSWISSTAFLHKSPARMPAAMPASLSNRSHLKCTASVCRNAIRFLSTGLQSETQDKQLPWIAAYKEREAKETEKRAAVKTHSSSWEASAEKYFARKDAKLSTENRKNVEVEKNEFEKKSASKLSAENRKNVEGEKNEFEKKSALRVNRSSWDAEEEEEEAEDAGPIDDPRWDQIKRKYTGFINRESRFERPEVRRWNKQENWGRKTWKEATESSTVPKMVGQPVYGVGPVLAALTVARREFYALYTQEGLDVSGNNRKKKDKKGVGKVLKMAEKIGLKVIEASKHDLNMVVDNRPHQGLVLDASPLEMVSMRELEPVSVAGKRAPLWVALDEVTDPQNLGAIVRSAYFFGAEGVVLCAKNSAPLSGVVSKASAGSLELIELRSCKNMMQFLSSSIENGWRVLGGSVSSKAVSLNEVKAEVPTVLVLGSEGSGLRPLVERSCTELIKIPGNIPMDLFAADAGGEDEEMTQSLSGQELKSFLAVESLNVSVAAGVLLYHLVGNNSQKNHLAGSNRSDAGEELTGSSN